MARPNSPLTRIRSRLSHWIDPCPDKGEAWCIGCSLNNGRTLIVPAPGHAIHLRLHRDQQGSKSNVAMRVNWGQVHPHYDEDEDGY